jgi:hypothetical protein
LFITTFPNTCKMIKARKVVRMGRTGIHTKLWWESQKERDH